MAWLRHGFWGQKRRPKSPDLPHLSGAQGGDVARASISDVALLLEVFFAVDLSASVTLSQGLKGWGTPLWRSLAAGK
jgi:hypothetical protein